MQLLFLGLNATAFNPKNPIAIAEIDEDESTHQVKQKCWVNEWRKQESNHNNLRVDLRSDKNAYKFTGEIVRTDLYL